MATLKTKNHPSTLPPHLPIPPSPNLSLSHSPLLSLSLFLILFLTFSPSHLYALDSLSYKIGQMVMTGFIPGTNFEDTLHYDIVHRNLGGVILMGYNLDNPAQIADLTASLQDSADIPLFIATDQEGGVVARLDETNGYAITERALTLGTINNEDTTRAEAALMAGWLHNAGINTNLAPVADVNVNPDSPAIGHYGRSFSVNPYIVSDHVGWFSDEFYRQKIVTALKHFPGHGSAVGDSHDGFTDITGTWSRSELIPFDEMIRSGYPGMIMTGHLYNAIIDSLYPATLSEATIMGILRDSLGFNGVIISDAMGMGAINNNYSFIESVVQAIRAGVDILLYTNNEKYERSIVKQIVRVVTTAVDSGLITEARIDESYNRIMALKTNIKTSIVQPRPLIADHFTLKAYPNPFNPATRITFTIADDIYETAQFAIYSITGQLVQRRSIDLNGPGDYQLVWNATNAAGELLPSGTYIYSVSYDNRLSYGKLTLIK